MSISYLLDQNTQGETWKHLYISNVNVSNDITTNNVICNNTITASNIIIPDNCTCDTLNANTITSDDIKLDTATVSNTLNATNLSSTDIKSSTATISSTLNTGTLNATNANLTSATITGTLNATDIKCVTNTVTDTTNSTTVLGSTGVFSDLIPSAINMPQGSNREIQVSRSTTGVGDILQIQAGDAKTGSTDTKGGDLILTSGASTGNVSSTVKIKTPAMSFTSGSTDNIPVDRIAILAPKQLAFTNKTINTQQLITVNVPNSRLCSYFLYFSFYITDTNGIIYNYSGTTIITALRNSAGVLSSNNPVNSSYSSSLTTQGNANITNPSWSITDTGTNAVLNIVSLSISGAGSGNITYASTRLTVVNNGMSDVNIV